MPETMSFLVPPEADGERLDKWLSGQVLPCKTGWSMEM